MFSRAKVRPDSVTVMAHAEEHEGLRRLVATTVATGMTGFGFPLDHLLPSRKVGFSSLAVLAAAAIRSRAERLTLRPSRAK